MSNIALRTYQQKIEIWIEENNIEKAISQCIILLKQFPRNFRTFQILSKALLQKQDFNSADKIFDIVLKIDPDDFVSHIGKSMIAEYNHLLDAAIEHMKFAFEIQPANEGLQNELKRLLLAEDGVEPNKINLTRGALIKMYLNGKLYNQAIAESRIGISETPQRIDYRVAFAKSLFETGDLIQAVKTSVEIISQLPYCWAANEILDKVLSKNHTIESNGFYHNRLVELDPYYGFMLSSTNSVFDVPDIAVMVEDHSEKEDFAYDLFPSITAIWDNQEQFPEKETQSTDAVDWDSIINKAIETPAIHEDFIEGEQVQFDDELISDDKIDIITNSRKKIFRDRLRSFKTTSNDSDLIPEWYFDGNGKISHNEKKSDFLESQSIYNEEDLSPISEQIESFSGENGVFDTDVPPAINDQKEIEQSKTLWLNDEENFDRTLKTNNGTKLDDTQQILVVQDNPGDLLLDSAKAIEGGNTEFALSTLGMLISKKQNLSEVSHQLERAIELYPERTDFHLLLGETYAQLGDKEKALAVFRNAQKRISL